MRVLRSRGKGSTAPCFGHGSSLYSYIKNLCRFENECLNKVVFNLNLISYNTLNFLGEHLVHAFSSVAVTGTTAGTDHFGPCECVIDTLRARARRTNSTMLHDATLRVTCTRSDRRDYNI